jgi:hypothetical protein
MLRRLARLPLLLQLLALAPLPLSRRLRRRALCRCAVRRRCFPAADPESACFAGSHGGALMAPLGLSPARQLGAGLDSADPESEHFDGSVNDAFIAVFGV